MGLIKDKCIKYKIVDLPYLFWYKVPSKDAKTAECQLFAILIYRHSIPCQFSPCLETIKLSILCHNIN